MSESQQRLFAAVVALQFQYFLGQRERGRFLTSEEMQEARRNVEEFLPWYFGDNIVAIARPAYPERGE